MELLAFLVYCELSTGCVVLPEKYPLERCYDIAEKVYYTDSSKNAQCIPTENGDYVPTKMMVEKRALLDK